MTEAQFREFFDLYPKGNFMDAYCEALYHQSSKEKQTSTGQDVDLEHMCNAWKKYLEVCEKEDRDTQYIKTMYSFISSGDYNNNFDFSLKKKAKYLSQWLDYER